MSTCTHSRSKMAISAKNSLADTGLAVGAKGHMVIDSGDLTESLRHPTSFEAGDLVVMADFDAIHPSALDGFTARWQVDDVPCVAFRQIVNFAIHGFLPVVVVR